jgi:hypothetical protein
MKTAELRPHIFPLGGPTASVYRRPLPILLRHAGALANMCVGRTLSSRRRLGRLRTPIGFLRDRDGGTSMQGAKASNTSKSDDKSGLARHQPAAALRQLSSVQHGQRKKVASGRQPVQFWRLQDVHSVRIEPIFVAHSNGGPQVMFLI